MQDKSRGDESDRDEEMELINAEFESMVADLSHDQSSPRTYLDELDEFARAEKSELFNPPHIKRGLHGSLQHFFEGISRWWKKPPRDDSDGAIV